MMVSHADLLDRFPLERVGTGGSRRNCYRLGDSGYCVKFYKPPEECVPGMMKRSIIRDIKRRRFDKKRNSSAMEVAYYWSHWMRMPEAVTSRILPYVELVKHKDWGYGILETYYANPDGSAIRPYQTELRRQTENMSLKQDIYRQARDILLTLINESAFFFEPGNFHVLFLPNGGVELKIVDFEPVSKTLIHLERYFPWYRRAKLKRKAKRFLAVIRSNHTICVGDTTEIG